MRFLVIFLCVVCFIPTLTTAQEQGSTDEKSADAWYQEGLRLCKSVTPDVAKALVAFDNVLRLNPQHSATAYKWRSWLKQRTGNLMGALEDINAAIALQSREPKFYAIRADLRKQMRDFAEAIHDYGLALQLTETTQDTAIYSTLRDSCILEQAHDTLASKNTPRKKNK